MLFTLILTLSVCVIAFLGDAVLDVTRKQLFRAIIDSFTHGMIGLLSWAVVVVKSYNGKLIINKRFEILLSGLIASGIDIDHFIYNKSLDINDALNLGENRPAFHCTTLLLFTCVIPYIYSQEFSILWLNRLSWIILVSGLSHHIRDATRRGLWFYPFGSTRPLPKPLYIGFLAVLPYAAWWIETQLDTRFILQSESQAGFHITLEVLVIRLLNYIFSFKI